MPARRLLLLAVVVFVATVLLRAPAGWLLAALPPALRCESHTGTLWSGQCGRLDIAGTVLHAVDWRLRPWWLLRGRLVVDLRSADARARGSARAVLGLGGAAALERLRAVVPIEAQLLPLLPAGWTGRIEFALERVDLEAGRLAGIEGSVTGLSLEQVNPPMEFGSYRLTFPGPARGSGDAPIVGQLRDLGGPLSVNGTLTIRNGRAYELAGTVATRAQASAALAGAIQLLGPSDAGGRRPFTLAGTF